MSITFKDLKLPETSFENGCVVLYKAWLTPITAHPVQGATVEAFDLNSDKDQYGTSEQAAILAAFNAIGMRGISDHISQTMFAGSDFWPGALPASEIPEGTPKGNAMKTEYTDGTVAQKKSKLKLIETDGGADTSRNILTIAKIKLIPEATEESCIVLPDTVVDPIPEQTDPFYDEGAGTLYATILHRIHDIQMEHNRISKLVLDEPFNGAIRIKEIELDPIQVNA